MFESDLEDEEIKKKKRRVLVVLLALMLGTAGALPFVEVTGAPSAAAESTPEPSTHTVAPTNTLQPPTHEPTRDLTETIAPTATPRPTATSTPIPVPPTATEEVPDGDGGGEPEASSTPTDAPTNTPADTPVPPTPTPEAPGKLPVTGADAGRSGRLALGLAVFSVGTLMLAVGLALHGEAAPASMSRAAPPTAVAQTIRVRAEQPADASPGPGTQVWLTLGLAAVVLVVVFIAGYTLRKTRKR